jgi:hypothetical protein
MGIKDFFFESSGEDKKPETSQPTVTRLGTMSTSAPTVTYSPSGSQDLEKFRAHFDQLFEQSNLPGPDYFEFSKMVDSMGNALPLETRITAAFQGLKIQGLTKEKLLSTAQEYLKILDADAQNFNKKVSEEVSSKKKLAEDIASLIEQKRVAIAQLQKEIEEQTISLQEYGNIEMKMTEKVAHYQTALSAMQSRITEDINKINLIQ